jgi:DnaK suppressor protein
MLVQSEEVARALDKLDEGTYGVCDSCGGVIPEGRLEIHPWAVRCVACAG